ncbi:MAG TPA: sulfite exporter TauE/SafE family protein [Bacillota bacterium]|nr:sulfite exporter TauE/SafE family protein [Bacillota bacterium]
MEILPGLLWQAKWEYIGWSSVYIMVFWIGGLVISSSLLLLLGLFAGFIGTILGLGGGFLIIPYLLLVGHFTPQLAVGTSLSIVFLNTLSGSWAYARQRRIDYATAIRFALATVPGSVVGAYMSRWYHGPTFSRFFAIFLLCMAAYLIYRTARPEKEKGGAEGGAGEEAGAAREAWGQREDSAPTAKKGWVHRVVTDTSGTTYVVDYDLRLGIITSFFVGLLASLLGIGGGIIHVPLMIYFLGFPPHLATATSHLILAISSFFAAGTHVFIGNVAFKTTLLVGIGAVAGAQLGAKAAKKVTGPWIIRGLSLAVIFLALRMLFS